MKLKELSYKLAHIICVKHLEKKDYSEHACKDCPLYLKNAIWCGKNFASVNGQYGDMEIDLKEYKDNE